LLFIGFYFHPFCFLFVFLQKSPDFVRFCLLIALLGSAAIVTSTREPELLRWSLLSLDVDTLNQYRLSFVDLKASFFPLSM